MYANNHFTTFEERQKSHIFSENEIIDYNKSNNDDKLTLNIGSSSGKCTSTHNASSTETTHDFSSAETDTSGYYPSTGTNSNAELTGIEDSNTEVYYV